MSPHALVIDDNLLNIEVLCMMLTYAGLSTTPLDHLQFLDQTLARLTESMMRVDVAFVDLEFPNGDGYQVLRKLKALPAFAKVPIVAYTVHTSEIDIARRNGFDSFLGKPLNTRRFPEQLRQILDHQPVWET